MGLAFFGLNSDNAPQYRLNLFSEIHDIAVNSGGGYTWDILYNLPIFLRKFAYHRIKESVKKQQENLEGSDNGKTNMIDSKGNIKTPDFSAASKQYKKQSSYK